MARFTEIDKSREEGVHGARGSAIAARTYGWERTTDPKGAIYFLTRMNYVADEGAARAALAGLPRLEMEGEPVVVYSQLDRTDKGLSRSKCQAAPTGFGFVQGGNKQTRRI